MSVWLTLAVNSIAYGGLLFLLSAGFSLIFGLMRIPNLMHGSFFMLGAYFGVTLLDKTGMNFWLAALISGAAMAVIGGVIERLLLRRLVAIAIALWLMIDWTRLGAMIRAGVDDAPIARVVGIKVSQLFTLVFALGAALAAFAGVVGAPYLSVYPGLDAEMLPLALIVVILGGTGSLLGALVGSFLIGFLYNFGQAMLPDLAYVILFLPMLLVLVLRPQGLFGRIVS